LVRAPPGTRSVGRDYNVQEHYAHRHRKKGRRSPSEVLAWVKTPRFKEEDLRRAFFSSRKSLAKRGG
jgi:hypothetical protein